MTFGQTTTLKAIAIRAGYQNSPIASAVYIKDTPPSISLSTRPTGSFIAPASITLLASVGDPDDARAPGHVVSVKFTATSSPGTVTNWTVTNAPFQVNWTNVLADTYTLVATATDENGQTATSNPVSITVACALPTLGSINLDPPSLSGGIPTTGTVTLVGSDGATPASALPGGQVITLAALDTAGNPSRLAAMPASITVPPGQFSAGFPIVTSAVPSQTSVTILATYHGVTRTAILVLTPGP